MRMSNIRSIAWDLIQFVLGLKRFQKQKINVYQLMISRTINISRKFYYIQAFFNTRIRYVIIYHLSEN